MSNARFSILQAQAVKDKRISDSQFRTLAALGMYADEQGWCFPSLKTLGKDLGKSLQAVGRDTIALKKLGYLEVKSRYDNVTKARHSNLYRLRFDLAPLQRDVEYPSTPDVEYPSTPDVEYPSTPDVEVNDPFNAPINDPAKRKKGDLVDLAVDLLGMPGLKKSQRFLGYESLIKVEIGIEPTRKKWQDFFDFVDKQPEQGQALKRFLVWLKQTPKFDPSFWGPERMRENWHRAFVPESQALQPQPEYKFVY